MPTAKCKPNEGLPLPLEWPQAEPLRKCKGETPKMFYRNAALIRLISIPSQERAGGRGGECFQTHYTED